MIESVRFYNPVFIPGVGEGTRLEASQVADVAVDCGMLLVVTKAGKHVYVPFARVAHIECDGRLHPPTAVNVKPEPEATGNGPGPSKTGPVGGGKESGKRKPR